MKITFSGQKVGHDHVAAYADGTYFGFRGLNTGKIYVTRCPKCSRENCAFSSADGICCWCGWNVNKEENIDNL